MWDSSPLQKHFIPGMALVSALVITLHRKMKCSSVFLSRTNVAIKTRKYFNFYFLNTTNAMPREILEYKSYYCKNHETAMSVQLFLYFTRNKKYTFMAIIKTNSFFQRNSQQLQFQIFVASSLLVAMKTICICKHCRLQ